MNREPTSNDQDWVAGAVDTLESVVDAIRSKTTEPALRIAQTIVFGLLATGVAIMMLLLLTIGSVRALDAYLPQGVWLAYLVVGGVFTFIGLILWRKRIRPKS